MKRKLLTQICNEWRSNLWLALELLIVSVVMWFITDYLYTRVSIINEPRGFDTSHCYRINFSYLTEQSPELDLERCQSQEINNNDLLTLVDRLEKRPEIECVAMGQNSYFYNGSNSYTRTLLRHISDQCGPPLRDSRFPESVPHPWHQRRDSRTAVGNAQGSQDNTHL